jgi:Type II secretion system (T2SS), protein F
MRLGGQRDKRARRELSLWCRELAMLLQNGTDPATALSILERQDFSPALRQMTAEMIRQAADGAPVDALFLGRTDLFPPVLAFAVKSAGDDPERLSAVLRDLADCLWCAADLGMALYAPPGELVGEAAVLSSEQAPVVRMVDSILRQALRIGASEVEIRATDDQQLAQIAYNLSGKWEAMAELPIEMLGPLCRRICILASINWWSREPALGSMTIHHGGGQTDASVRFMPGDQERDLQVYVGFAEAPDEAEPS